MKLNKAIRVPGFTLIELISVLVLVAILATTFISKTTPSNSFQIQASRDQLVAAFFIAQQKAMVQSQAIQLSTSGTTIDIRQNADANGVFSSTESMTVGGISYPIEILPNQSLSSSIFVYDRLGQTTAGSVTLTQGTGRVDVVVSATGFAE